MKYILAENRSLFGQFDLTVTFYGITMIFSVLLAVYQKFDTWPRLCIKALIHGRGTKIQIPENIQTGLEISWSARKNILYLPPVGKDNITIANFLACCNSDLFSSQNHIMMNIFVNPLEKIGLCVLF